MSRTPSGLPILARGKHRSPRRGACLMEYTSVIAGERWSDSPVCTHPALAALARAVNDCTADAARQQLIELAPLLVHAHGSHLDDAVPMGVANVVPTPAGRVGALVRRSRPAVPADPLGPRLARKAVLQALEVTTGVRRRTLLVALLGAEAACGPQTADDPDHEVVRDLLREPDPDLRAALSFVAGVRAPADYHLRGVVAALHLAVRAIVDGAGPRANERLRDLLVDSVAEARGGPVRQPARGR